jgi:hypothetical protein
MNEVEFETAPPPARPSTTTVISLLAVIAAVFSYLIAYAMANALIAAEVLKPWAKDHDPRPLRFVVCFVVLIILFAGFGAFARFMSARNLRQIDAMEQDA